MKPPKDRFIELPTADCMKLLERHVAEALGFCVPSKTPFPASLLMWLAVRLCPFNITYNPFPYFSEPV